MMQRSWRGLGLGGLPLAVLLAFPLAARAQVTDTLRLADRMRNPAAADSASARRGALPSDSTQPGRVSPRGAFFRSLVIPGWGQSAIGAPGRGAVYFGLETASLWMVYKSDQKLQEARRLQQANRESGLLSETQTSGLVRARRNEREDWITLSVFWMFFSGADAFVAAHLRDFDAHVGAMPAPEGALQLQVSVPVGP
jgi:hypothetical protein